MQALFGQLLIGLINGAFYAMLSLGLAVIFGLLNIINFTHGAQYMMGAFCAWFLLNKAVIGGTGIGYWPALIIAPIAVGAFGMLIERTMLARTNPPTMRSRGTPSPRSRSAMSTPFSNPTIAAPFRAASTTTGPTSVSE